MALVTKETERSVQNMIDRLDHISKREDSQIILELIEQISGYQPKVWGNEKAPDFLIGFGKYKYRRKNSKEDLEWFHVGFAPRKNKITIYLAFDINEEKHLLDNLGKCKWGKGCLYINKLEHVNLGILKQLIEKSKNARWH